MRYVFIVILVVITNFIFAQGFSGGGKIDIVQYKLYGIISKTNSYTPIYTYEENSGLDMNFNILLGYNFRIKKFNDDLAIGFDLNLGFGRFGKGNLEGLNGSLIIDFPEYLVIYYGYNATKYSEKEYGVAFGIGYEYTYMALPYQSPSLMIEGANEGYKLRLSFNPLYYSYYETFENSVNTYERKAISLRNISVSLIYMFGE